MLYLLFLGLVLAMPMASSAVVCEDGGQPPTQSFRLIEAVPERPSGGQFPQVFVTGNATVPLMSGGQVLLSSTPDGSGPLVTDDRVSLTVHPSGEQWSHDFRNAQRTAILPHAPIDLTPPSVSAIVSSLALASWLPLA